jgi:hypothetical protein
MNEFIVRNYRRIAMFDLVALIAMKTDPSKQIAKLVRIAGQLPALPKSSKVEKPFTTCHLERSRRVCGDAVERSRGCTL